LRKSGYDFKKERVLDGKKNDGGRDIRLVMPQRARPVVMTDWAVGMYMFAVDFEVVIGGVNLYCCLKV
jgi:hypothetical protein